VASLLAVLCFVTHVPGLCDSSAQGLLCQLYAWVELSKCVSRARQRAAEGQRRSASFNVSRCVLCLCVYM